MSVAQHHLKLSRCVCVVFIKVTVVNVCGTQAFKVLQVCVVFLKVTVVSVCGTLAFIVLHSACSVCVCVVLV
jgi:hypothetical protein